MATLFDITTPANTIRLDPVTRKGEASFTVTNYSGRVTRGRARLRPQDERAAPWLKLVGEGERSFPLGGSHQYTVEIVVPPDAPAGPQVFRFDMVDVSNPDERYTEGPTVAFTVPEPVPVPPPPPPRPKFPWWILLVIVAILVVIGIVYLLTRPRTGQIAFVSFHHLSGENLIEIMDSDGANRKVLSTGLDTSRGDGAKPLVWSPDGRQIAFMSAHEGAPEIYVMNADGTNQRNITQVPQSDDNPLWSRDGRLLAFVSYRFGGADIFTMRADGTQVTRLTQLNPAEYGPVWSPDGRRIAYVSTVAGLAQIHVMNADGSGQSALTQGPGANYSPQWSAGRNRIAFVSERSGAQEIYVMNADGTGQTNVSNHPANDVDPVWSPDGNRIAFVTYREGSSEVYVINANGTGQVNLSRRAGEDMSPAWSPDGRQIAFVSAQESNGLLDIYVVSADGSSGAVNLTNTPQVDEYQPQWKP